MNALFGIVTSTNPQSQVTSLGETPVAYLEGPGGADDEPLPRYNSLWDLTSLAAEELNVSVLSLASAAPTSQHSLHTRQV